MSAYTTEVVIITTNHISPHLPTSPQRPCSHSLSCVAQCCPLTVAAACPLSDCASETRGCAGACMHMRRLLSVGSDGLHTSVMGPPTFRVVSFSRAECADVPVWWRVARGATADVGPMSEWSPGPCRTRRTRRGNAAERSADTCVPSLALVGVRDRVFPL